MPNAYYLINVAHGDDNDQSWTDLIIACSQDHGTIHDAIIALFESQWSGGEEGLAEVDIMADVEVVYCLWYENEIPYHSDYHIEGAYLRLGDAVENIARYHAKDAVYDYDDRTGELRHRFDLVLDRDKMLSI